MPIHLLYGGDTYLIQRALDWLRSKGEFDDTDVTRIDTRRVPPSEALMIIGTPSLFSNRRLIILEGLGETPKNADRAKTTSSATGKAKTTKKPVDEPITIAALASITPAETSVVIIGSSLTGKSPLVSEAKKMKGGPTRVELQEYVAPKEKDMQTWLMTRAKKQSINLDARAANLLAQRVGTQVEVAGAELEKLKLAAGPEGVVDSKLVDQLVPDTVENSIFPLIEAIAAGKRDQAIHLLHRQINQSSGTETELSLGVLRLLARHFRILLRIQLLEEDGASTAAITETLRLHSYFAGQYFAQAARFSRRQMFAVFERLAAIDQAIKTGEAGEAVLDLLVFDMSPAARPAR